VWKSASALRTCWCLQAMTWPWLNTLKSLACPLTTSKATDHKNKKRSRIYMSGDAEHSQGICTDLCASNMPLPLTVFPNDQSIRFVEKTGVNGGFMFIFKLGLLTCAFYVALTVLLEAGIWALAHFRGFGMYFATRDWFWGVGLRLGFIFGTLWAISFGAAWYITYMTIIKPHLPILRIPS
jgi:hypothetical protein